LGFNELGLKPQSIFGVVPTGSESYFELDKTESRRGEFRIIGLKKRLEVAMGLEKWIKGKSIIEEMLEQGYPDTIFVVSDEEARDMADRLCKEEGVYCGMSSGANVAVALKIAERLGPNKNVVTVIVDRRDRYLSEMPNEKYVV
jgi:cysteine synthase